MKVLQINTVCGTGSIGRITVDLCRLLEKNGHECCVAYGRGKAPDGVKSIKIGGFFNAYVHGILSRITDRHGFYSRRATRSFLKKVMELRPDVIHLHNLHGYYINIELLFQFLKKANIPVVWTLHDAWAFTGHCSHFDYIKCTRWKTGCYKCPQKNCYPKSIWMDHSEENYRKKRDLFTLPDNMTVITPSEWLCQLVRESFLKKYQIAVINNGVNLNIFKPVSSTFKKAHGLEKKKIILGVSNVWSERKGLSFFMKLASELDNSYQIVLVGVTKGQRRRLGENIIGIEKVGSAYELAKIYSAAEVFLNPTYEDTYPTTNIEALACGTPVITFLTGGSGELIQNQDCIVPQDDKDRILELLKTEAYKEKYQIKTERIDEAYCFQKYLELYQQAVTNHRSESK